MIVQTGFVFNEVGESYLITDPDSEKPYRVVTVPNGGVAVAETGWCKTRDYVEKTLSSLTEQGYEYKGSVDYVNGDPLLLAKLRVSKWSPSDLKSSIQKYVRRGYIQEAVNVAFALTSTREGEGWLRRRLAVFAIEDVGWEYLAVSPLADLYRHVAWLASVPKSNEAALLTTVAKMQGAAAHHDPYVTETVKAFGIEAFNYQHLPELMGMCQTDFARSIVDAAGRKTMQGFRADDIEFLKAAAVIAAFDSPVGLPDDGTLPDYDTPVMPEELAWWSTDGHSAVGHQAKRIAAKRLGADPEHLDWVWFYAESAKIEPKRECRWEDEAREQIAEWCRVSTYDQLLDLWEEWKPTVERAVLQVMERK